MNSHHRHYQAFRRFRPVLVRTGPRRRW